MEYTDKKYILEEIKNAYFYPNSKKFAVINFNKDNLKLYDDLNITFKPKDTKFIIHSLKGIANKDLDECLRLKKIVNTDISKITRITKQILIQMTIINIWKIYCLY